MRLDTGVLELLLRFQHDPKPLKAVISGVLFRHASGSAAPAPDPVEQQQLTSSSQRPAKRARRGGKDYSPAQPVPEITQDAQNASSRQPDSGERDIAQQQAPSQRASGAAMRALRSVGANAAGRADDLDDDLEHDMEAEPSRVQGLLDATASRSGALPHPPLTCAHADYLACILALQSSCRLRLISVGATLRSLAEDDMRCPVMTHGSHNKH